MSPLRVPAPGATKDNLCDWLELSAFFSEFSKSRLDELSAGMKTLEEEAPSDIGDRDAEDDHMRSEIEQEIDERTKKLGDAYPFQLSADAEELILRIDYHAPEAAFYILCLVASHVAASPVLATPPTGASERQMRRRAFQVLGTLAMAGWASGPAVSVGWPRETKETILEVLARAEAWGVGLKPKNQPGRHANPHDKDGGIDAISWRLNPEPPPRFVAFGQLASGNDWRNKPVKADVHPFLNDFFEDHGTGNHVFVTVIPHRVADQNVFQSECQRHGNLAYRLSAPRHALDGLRLASEGVPMDEAANFEQIGQWLFEYRAFAVGVGLKPSERGSHFLF
jgi:hypothetical protein